MKRTTPQHINPRAKQSPVGTQGPCVRRCEMVGTQRVAFPSGHAYATRAQRYNTGADVRAVRPYKSHPSPTVLFYTVSMEGTVGDCASTPAMTREVTATHVETLRATSPAIQATYRTIYATQQPATTRNAMPNIETPQCDVSTKQQPIPARHIVLARNIAHTRDVARNVSTNPMWSRTHLEGISNVETSHCGVSNTTQRGVSTTQYDTKSTPRYTPMNVPRCRRTNVPRYTSMNVPRCRQQANKEE